MPNIKFHPGNYFNSSIAWPKLSRIQITGTSTQCTSNFPIDFSMDRWTKETVGAQQIIILIIKKVSPHSQWIMNHRRWWAFEIMASRYGIVLVANSGSEEIGRDNWVGDGMKRKNANINWQQLKYALLGAAAVSDCLQRWI